MGDWHSDNTILTMTTNHAADGAAFTLQPNNDYQLRMVVNKAKAADANGLPLILGGEVDLLSGFTFTTGTAVALNYPKVELVTIGQSQSDPFQLAVVPGTPTSSVPKVPTLVMDFSQSMDEQSVLNSTLRITDLNDIGSQADDVSFDMQIEAATAGQNPLATLNWPTTTPDGTAITPYTRLELTFGSYQGLQAGNLYKLQMVDNQAEGDNGLPLILGGDINLLDGFQFQVNRAPPITEGKNSGYATIANNPSLIEEIDEDG